MRFSRFLVVFGVARGPGSGQTRYKRFGEENRIKWDRARSVKVTVLNFDPTPKVAGKFTR
jgi:hypothetical protein